MRFKAFISFLILVMLSLAAFGSVLYNGFVYDDLLIIYGNPFFTTRANLFDLFSENYFALSRQGSYRPMVTLSYMMDGAVWGIRPMGFHLTNLLMHLANMLLLFRISKRFGVSNRTSFLGAALFAVHPVFSEVVSFPNYREDLLVLLFSLSSLGCLIGSRKSAVGSRRALFIRYTASAILYGFALLSKESGLGFLIFLFIFEWTRRGVQGSGFRVQKRRNLEHPTESSDFLTLPYSHTPILPYIAVTAIYLWLRFDVYGASNELSASYIGGDIFTNTLTMCRVFLSYFLILIFPVHLRPDYLISPATPFNVALSVGGTLLLFVMVYWKVVRKRQHPYMTLGCGWFIAFLLPVMNLYPIAHPKAERYLYIPCAGLFLLLGAGMDRLWRYPIGRWKQRLVAGAISLVFICFIGLARVQVEAYRDNLHLWKVSVRCEPDSLGAQNNLGIEYLEQGQADEALRRFRRASSLGVLSKRLALNLVRAKAIQANLSDPNNRSKAMTFDQAIHEYRIILETLPEESSERAHMHHGLAILLRQAGYLEEALAEHPKAILRNPLADDIRLHYGITLQKAGRLNLAVQQYREALQLFPGRAQTHYNLGTALEALHRMNEARSVYEMAIQLSSEYPEAHAGLATVLLRHGVTEACLNHFQIALKHQPNHASWRYNYLQALLRLGRLDEARKQFRVIQSLSPLNPSLREALRRIQKKLQLE